MSKTDGICVGWPLKGPVIHSVICATHHIKCSDFYEAEDHDNKMEYQLRRRRRSSSRPRNVFISCVQSAYKVLKMRLNCLLLFFYKFI